MILEVFAYSTTEEGAQFYIDIYNNEVIFNKVSD